MKTTRLSLPMLSALCALALMPALAAEAAAQPPAGPAGGEQPEAGQTASGQTADEQPDTGQAASGQTAGERTDAGQAASGQAAGEQTDAGQAASGQTAGERTDAEQAEGGQPADGQTDAGQAASGQEETPAENELAEGVQVASEQPEAEEPQPRLPLDALRVFAEAFNRVSSAYVEEINDKALLEKAIRGFLAELDPHSAFLDAPSYADLQETTEGQYGGLGLQVDLEDGFVKVVSPMDGTPAARAGLAAHDLIVKLDDTPVQGMNLSEAVETMRGEAGTQITLTVLKAGESETTEITLTREVIDIASVRHERIEGFGYIRIAQFQRDTGTEVEKALNALAADGQLPGLVLDLRRNPGGVLEAGIHVADLFINEGLIVYTEGRLEEAKHEYRASRPDMAVDIPMVALVDSGTASASEIVAGALKDHGRALVMGTDTFGKGSVQTVLPLTNERAIKLTTARYYTPSGNSIQAEGIVPDIFVAASTVTPLNRRGIKEKDLPGHLERSEDGQSPDTQGSMELAQRDFQLHEALTLLKGLSLFSAAKTAQPETQAPPKQAAADQAAAKEG